MACVVPQQKGGYRSGQNHDDNGADDQIDITLSRDERDHLVSLGRQVRDAARAYKRAQVAAEQARLVLVTAVEDLEDSAQDLLACRGLAWEEWQVVGSDAGKPRIEPRPTPAGPQPEGQPG